MKMNISTAQLTMLIGNYLFSGIIISLPQALTDEAGHNVWIVPLIVMFPIFAVIYFVLGKPENIIKASSTILIQDKKPLLEKGFLIIFFIFFTFIFAKDMRALVDFVATVLLPTTPIDVITVLSTLTVVYLASSGVEVIARVNFVQFVLLGVVISLLPLMMLNEMDFSNFQPILRVNSFPHIFHSSFLLFSWVGESIFFLIMVNNIEPVKNTRKAVIVGISIALFLLFLLLTTQIAVLGKEIVRISTYPSHQLIQQINLTDFLDRVDLVIVTLWVPSFLVKLAVTLFVLNKCISFNIKTQFLIVPLGLALGLLSIVLFKNSMEQMSFSFFTWAILGLAFEGMISVLYFIIRKKSLKRKSESM